MTGAIDNGTKKKLGRPAIGPGFQVQVRLRSEQLSKLDAWIAEQPDQPTRPEAVRRLLADVLK